MKKVILIGAISLMVCCAAFFTIKALSKDSAEDVPDRMLKAVREQGFPELQEVSMKDHTVCFTAKIEQEYPQWKKMLLLSAEKRQARAAALKELELFKDCTVIRQVIVSASGKILYDVSLADFAVISEGDPEAVRIRDGQKAYSSEETVRAVKEAFSAKGVPLETLDCTEYSLGGYLLKLTFRNDGRELTDTDRIDQAVNDGKAALIALNKAGHSIGAVEIEYRPAGGDEPLYVFSGDLIYGDFSWWQSPDLGHETWTGNTLKTPQAAEKRRRTVL